MNRSVLDHAGDRAQRGLARLAGSAIRPSWASRIQWPPSVTKTWPSLPCRTASLARTRRSRKRAASIAAPRRAEPERHDLDRQRKAAERRHPFALVGDHDHACRGGRHDLLAQQRAAAALDQGEIGIDLVGAVDGQVEIGRSRRAWSAACRSAPHRRASPPRSARRSTLRPARDPLAQQLDEMLGGRAGAEAELHAVAHLFQRARRGLPLQLVHVHVRARLSGQECLQVSSVAAGLCSLVFPRRTGSGNRPISRSYGPASCAGTAGPVALGS